MAFQFCCPQGHVLQGEMSQVGQLFQCPMCGTSFLVPPPTTDPASMGGPAAAGGFFPGPGTWPATSAPGPAFPPQDGMSGMMPPQNMPMMPGPMPAGPMPTGPYPMPGPQPFAFGPATVNQPAAPAPPTPVTPQQPPPESPASETVKPAFDLGFDPSAKAALPFDLPGFSGPAEQTPAAPLPAPSFPAPSFPAPAFPAGFAAPTMPVTPLQPGAGNQDFLQSVPTVRDEPSWAGGTPPAPADFLASMPAGPEKATEKPPTVLHIRCPSGHLVVATSDLLGKNGRCPACKKTFELRYEDSVEFKRRKEKILQREEIKTGNAWLAWAFLAAFLVFAGLVGLVLVFGR